jgi:hypothetical protein
MKSEDALAVQGEIQPANLLQALIHVATTPGISIDVIERMVALQERQESRQRETAFWAALGRVQAKVPIIHKGGTNTFTKTTYARREDVARIIQPLLAEEGMALTFDEGTASQGVGWKKIFGKLSHRDGHSEAKSIEVPIDEAAKSNTTGKPTRTGIQDIGSTSSYAQRYLIKMWLNMAETDEDTDGNSSEKITDDQAKDLEIAVQDAGMDKGRFFVFMGVGGFDEILASDWKKAINAVDTKRRDNAAKGAK